MAFYKSRYKGEEVDNLLDKINNLSTDKLVITNEEGIIPRTLLPSYMTDQELLNYLNSNYATKEDVSTQTINLEKIAGDFLEGNKVFFFKNIYVKPESTAVYINGVRYLPLEDYKEIKDAQTQDIVAIELIDFSVESNDEFYVEGIIKNVKYNE